MENSLLFHFQRHTSGFFKKDFLLKIKSFLFLGILLFSSSLFSQTTIILPADQTSWYIPCDVTTITVEVWGAGGGGQGVTGNGNAGRGGGGSGGGYVKNTLTVTPNTTVNYYVGLGGTGGLGSANQGQPSWFYSDTTLKAIGGAGATVYANNISGTGITATPIGNIGGAPSTYGGNGGNSFGSVTGGGGASAGNAKGNNASGTTGGTAATNSYAGANGINLDWGDGNNGNIGAGGSGAKKGIGGTTWIGGKGGSGQIRITYTSAIPGGYCMKSYPNVEPITNVTFAGINNTTSALTSSPGYENFCLTGTVAQGQTYPASLKGNTVGVFDNNFTVFIDFNRNGNFSDTGERFNIGVINNSTGIDAKVTTGSIQIPLTATLGTTKMRVVKNYLKYADDCDSETFGQVEDYLINITLPAACTGTPIGGTTTLTPATGAPSSIFVASVAGGTVGGTGLTYQWETSPNGLAPWTDISGATGATANITAEATAGTTRSYRRKISCSGSSSYSTVQTFTTNAFVYCTRNFNTTYPITNVTFAGIVNNTSATSIIAYENFTNTGNVVKGTTLPISFRSNTKGNYTFYITVYIDWDQNGVLGNKMEEITNIGFIKNSNGDISSYTLLGNIIVPANAPSGITKMRVINNNGTNGDACITSSFGQAEDYVINVIAPTPCAGTPTADIVTLSSYTGAPSTPFTATASTPSTNGGLTYQWEIADTAGGPWTNIVGETGVVANLKAVPFSSTVRHYRRKVTCTNSGLFAYSNVLTYTTTAAPPYCIPTVSSGYAKTHYIKSVSFKGTLVEAVNEQVSPTWYSTTPNRGYQNYTGLPIAKSVQAQGGGVNVVLVTEQVGFYKAWVDWNGNGVFTDSGEDIYNPGGTGQLSTTFGFKIPNDTPPGDYRIRIRTNKYYNNDSENDNPEYGTNNSTFNSCDNLSEFGETEDYLFTVVANCWSMVTGTTDAKGCAGKSVDLKAESSGTVTEFRWYDSPTGGSLEGISLPDAAGETVWTTPILSATKTFYVTAYGGCESLSRVPAKAFINPVPVITFTPSSAKACGDNSIVKLSASGNNQTDWLINDNFEAGNYGEFLQDKLYTNTGTIDEDSKWTNRSSAFVANAGKTWTPAVSSGAQGNKFLMTTSDIGKQTPIGTTLTSVKLNTTGYNNLRLKFKMYYSRYFKGFEEEPTKDYVKIQASVDGGTNWTDIDHLLRDVGEASAFIFPGESAAVPFSSYDLSAFINQTNFKLRILYYANDWCDGVAIDDVELYGEKDLAASFKFDTNNPINFYSDAAATIQYVENTPISAVYIKPSVDQMEQYTSWNIKATALLDNLCTATGKVQVENFSKIWNAGSSTEWNDASKWKPAGLPDLTTCVIVRTPLLVGTALNPADAKAKTITILENGALTIKTGSALTVNDEVINRVLDNPETRLIVENDANLVQNTDAAVNIGQATVHRNSSLKKEDYTYWASPVANQNLKTFSTGTPSARFYTYNEADDLFYHVPPGTNVFGNNREGTFESAAKGYAIMAYDSYSPTVPSVFPGAFKGKPNNGVITFPLAYRGVSGGYNLVGNPYPSNINFTTFATDNSSAIESVAYFWTNINPNREMQGSAYPTGGLFNNYAMLNLIGGIPAGFAITSNTNNTIKSATPTNIIKVGQGFIVRAIGSGKILTFKNAERSVSSSSNFFNKGIKSKNQASDDRYWIHLTTPLGVVSTALVGYKEGATNQFDKNYDAELLVLGADALFTILDDLQLGIQGRKGPLVTDDVIPLGTNHYAAGTYIISLGDREGIFENDQSIYLRDKETGLETDLSQNDYIFTAKKGLTEQRFELAYQRRIVLGTGESTKENLVIYKDGGDYVLKSASKRISELEMYDASGRLMYKSKPNNYKTVVPAENLAQGVYVLKINLEGEITSKKVLK